MLIDFNGNWLQNYMNIESDALPPCQASARPHSSPNVSEALTHVIIYIISSFDVFYLNCPFELACPSIPFMIITNLLLTFLNYQLKPIITRISDSLAPEFNFGLECYLAKPRWFFVMYRLYFLEHL